MNVSVKIIKSLLAKDCLVKLCNEMEMVLQKFNLIINGQINLNLLLQMVLWTVEIMSGLV